MKVLSEKDLRAIADSEEFEGVDIKWRNGTDGDGSPHAFTGRILFDYDQGLSVLNKDDSEDCLTCFHGPSYKKENDNYASRERYHNDLSVVVRMFRDGYYDAEERQKLLGDSSGFGFATCSFS